MSTLVEARVPADQFGLATTFATVPDAEFRLVRLVAHGGDGLMPFLWAHGDDQPTLREALADDESVGDVAALAEFADECLVKVDWRTEVRDLATIVREEQATILDVHGRSGTWRLQLLFPEHDGVSMVYDRCDETGIDLTLERICDMEDTRQRGGIKLTEEQYQAIARAYEAGYYDVPRRVNQEELAKSFDVSHQALSERLRRGHQTVIANLLFRTLQRPHQAITPPTAPEIDG